jgi:sugar lactone lactonase YvrE
MSGARGSRFCAALAVAAVSACSGSSSSPPPPTYTIGGTVSGLTVPGLQLTDGIDVVAVAANVTKIQFPTAVVGGTPFDVLPTRQPLGFTEVCSVANGAGIVASSNVTSVAISCQPATAQVSLFAGNSLGAIHATSAALDNSGNLYVASAADNDIIKITPAEAATILAGSAAAGSADGAGAAAGFNDPSGVAVDTAGNVYVADTGNNEIRKVTPAGSATTLAGRTTAGSQDGTGAAAGFSHPSGVAVDAAGNIYVADQYNNEIRKITPAGLVSTLAGSIYAGRADGIGAAASFNFPSGVAADAAGNVYVLDAGNNEVRKITPAGMVTTLVAGGITQSCSFGCLSTSLTLTAVAVDAAGNVYIAQSISGLSGGPQYTDIAEFTSAGAGPFLGYRFPTSVAPAPTGLAVDAAGNAYLVSTGSSAILTVTAAGMTTAFVPSAGSANATGAAASFNSPAGIAIDAAGNIYVADSGNNEIRQITPAGVVTTRAGSTIAGSADGAGIAATFRGPSAVAVDAPGNIYVADTGNNEIRKIAPAGTVTTLAGTTTAGAADGLGSAASFNGPAGVAVDAAGNVYVADANNHEVREITPAGMVTTLAGSASVGNANGAGAAASFYLPYGVAVDADGDVYVADAGFNQIRKIAPGGVVTTLAGDGFAGSTDGASAVARFSFPAGIAVDAAGNIYVADLDNNEIRRVTPAGLVSTLAGSTHAGNSDGAGAAASFYLPSAVAVNAFGEVYAADAGNNEIRKVTPQ